MGSLQNYSKTAGTTTTWFTNANFDVNYTPVSSNYPGATPSQIVVQKDDTLHLIAARIYGDANLWYLIGEANGLSDADAPLTAGTMLHIPSKVVTLSNTSNSFKPFDVSAAIGNTSPTMAMPPAQQEGCGVVGMVIMIIVAIVVTYFTAGAAATAFGGVVGSTTGATVAGVGGLTAGEAFAAGAIGGVVGSVASQAVGIGIGAQEDFNWKAVAAAGLTGGILEGTPISSLGDAASASPFVSGAIQGTINSVIGQGINIVLGLQESFDWKQLAVSALASGVTKQVGNWTKDAVQSGSMPKLARDILLGATSGAVRMALDGRVEAVQVVADIFGNAIGNGIVDAMQPTPVSTSSGNNNNNQQQSSSANTSSPSNEDDLSPVVVNLPPRPQSAVTVDQTPGNDGGVMDVTTSSPDDNRAISAEKLTDAQRMDRIKAAKPDAIQAIDDASKSDKLTPAERAELTKSLDVLNGNVNGKSIDYEYIGTADDAKIGKPMAVGKEVTGDDGSITIKLNRYGYNLFNADGSVNIDILAPTLVHEARHAYDNEILHGGHPVSNLAQDRETERNGYGVEAIYLKYAFGDNGTDLVQTYDLNHNPVALTVDNANIAAEISVQDWSKKNLDAKKDANGKIKAANQVQIDAANKYNKDNNIDQRNALITEQNDMYNKINHTNNAPQLLPRATPQNIQPLIDLTPYKYHAPSSYK